MPSHLSILVLGLLSSTASASPLENLRGLELRGVSISNLFARQSCANACGWSGQLCCSSTQYCYTDGAGQAACGEKSAASSSNTGSGVGSAGDGGYWQTFTTTYVRTDLVTITSVGSSYVGVTPAMATPQPSQAQCDYSLNQSPCGPICCASDQYCVASGQCGQAANPASSSGFASTFSATAAGSTVGFLPPLRPTESTMITRTTAGMTPTATVGFLAPVMTGANVTVLGPTAQPQTGGGGLSGGAIAGIVIGVLLGLGLLFLICFCCCLKGLFDGLLALLGFGKRRRREREVETTEEEYVSRRRRGDSGDTRSWYGSEAPRRVVREKETRRTNSGLKEAAGIAGGLAALGTFLGLKRARDRRKERSRYGGSSDGSEDSRSTSESSLSSYVQPPPRTRSRSRTVRSQSRRPV